MRRVLPLAFALLLVFAATAQAVHWPYFGGDAGRSGLQPVDQGATPVASVYESTSPPLREIRTPVLTSAGGGPAAQRVIFGTAAADLGAVHLRVLATGAAVGPDAGRDIREATGTGVFGSGVGSVGFADTSTATALGQVFVVHNDPGAASADPDIEIAQIDQATGDLIGQADIAGTANLSIESSAVATGPDAAGTRSLFFVAGPSSATRLFKLTIMKAGARDAVIGQAQGVAVNATPTASPTFANLGGVPHVVVGTADGNVKSFKVADLMPGPSTAAPLRTAPTGGGTVQAQTPSVPVGPDGTPPATAPDLTVAVGVDPASPVGANSTQVFRLRVDGNSLVKVANAESDSLAGAPAPALAVGQQRVVVTTASNLYSLDGATLKDTKMLSSAALAAGQGFANNTALVSGAFAYVTRDNGAQLVLRLADAQPVAATEFTSKAPEASNTSAFGQPSLSRGFVQFGTSQGLFVYRNKDLVAPVAALGELTGGPFTATASDARGIASVTFRVNGQAVGTDTMPDSGSPFNAMMPATFSVPRPTLPAGTYTVDAVAGDGTLTTVTAARQLVVPRAPTTMPPTGTTPPTARRKARRITARLTPRRDRRAPYRFTVRGKLTPPTGVTRAQACRGRVAVRVRAGRRTLVTRRTTLTARCTYRIRVSVRSRRGRAKLALRVRFEGNPSLSPQTVRTLSARVR